MIDNKKLKKALSKEDVSILLILARLGKYTKLINSVEIGCTTYFRRDFKLISSISKDILKTIN